MPIKVVYSAAVESADDNLEVNVRRGVSSWALNMVVYSATVSAETVVGAIESACVKFALNTVAYSATVLADTVFIGVGRLIYLYVCLFISDGEVLVRYTYRFVGKRS